MKEIVLLKLGEIVLKGLNKNTFEDILMKNVRAKLRKYGTFSLKKAQSIIYVEPTCDCDINEVCVGLSKVFGVSTLSRACQVEKDIDVISEISKTYLKDALADAKTFKVEAKRSDKKFPLKSPDITKLMGGVILSEFPHLKVDVHNPEVTVTIEIRDFAAYIRASKIQGAGGLPVGTGGKGLLMLSGGIDSPVAGYMMSKRGVRLFAIHFESPPYTSLRALMKVEKLGEILSEYTGKIDLFIVPFTEIQEKIKEICKEDLFTIIMRRVMVYVANEIAQKYGLQCLITGESLGQVASQTLSAIACTDSATEIPILRPLIGMDKDEIVKISRKIDTFDTSVLPYEDCCTVFTPKHPKTKPNIEDVQTEEEKLDLATLINKAIEDTTRKMLG